MNKKKLIAKCIITVASIFIIVLLISVLKEYAEARKTYVEFSRDAFLQYIKKCTFFITASIISILIIALTNLYIWLGDRILTPPAPEQIAARDKKRKERIEEKKKRLEEKLNKYT
ncbi:MAG: hypothetical protein LBP26_02585 [Clostridiales bacterium]|jgi:hypothetical protein|nr:hypothetical protein [Clostridiales bacterium]